MKNKRNQAIKPSEMSSSDIWKIRLLSRAPIFDIFKEHGGQLSFFKNNYGVFNSFLRTKR